jgi:hypothetical protein
MDHSDLQMLTQAIHELANGGWTNESVQPSVFPSNNLTLFPISPRDQFQVDYPRVVPYWRRDHEFKLDFIVDDPISTPFLEELGILWCAPCHALINANNVSVASITGILTFPSWTERDEFGDFFDLENFETEPHLVALSSLPRLEIDVCQKALEESLELVYEITSLNSTELELFMNSPQEDL